MGLAFKKLCSGGSQGCKHLTLRCLVQQRTQDCLVPSCLPLPSRMSHERREGGRKTPIADSSPLSVDTEDQASLLPRIRDPDPACAMPAVGDSAASPPPPCPLASPREANHAHGCQSCFSTQPAKWKPWASGAGFPSQPQLHPQDRPARTFQDSA